MSIKLPPAADLDNHVDDKNYEPTMESIVERWINEKVVPQVLSAQREAKRHAKKCSVGIRPPPAADTFLKSQSVAFYAELDRVLNPLGYTTEKGHDGAGMYEVTYIYWELK